MANKGGRIPTKNGPNATLPGSQKTISSLLIKPKCFGWPRLQFFSIFQVPLVGGRGGACHALPIFECIKYSKFQLFTSTHHLLHQTRYILSRYKILINDRFHNISNHIKNIHEELSHRVLKENKIHSIVAASFNGKEAQNSADYRKSLLIITHWFIENLKIHFTTDILISVWEI